MNIEMVVPPLAGGALIGLAVTMMLLFNGRVAGISGIVAGALTRPKNDSLWRVLFIAGMLVGGVLVQSFNPDLLANLSGRSVGVVALAGFLVGYGTVMGGGCTSGHGVCGISRMSIRSILATLTFMLFGFLTVAAFQFFVGGGQ